MIEIEKIEGEIKMKKIFGITIVAMLIMMSFVGVTNINVEAKPIENQANANPVLLTPIPDFYYGNGESFSEDLGVYWQDVGDLTLNLVLDDGNPLPAWMYFDSGNNTMWGVTQSNYIADLKCIAEDMWSNITEEYFSIISPSPINYQITNIWELQNITSDLSGDYNIMNDIDASITSGWNGGLGFIPLGYFYGNLTGNGHTISNLFINNSVTESGVFKKNYGNISNINFINYSMLCDNAWRHGGLVGDNFGFVKNINMQIIISSLSSFIGGLVGGNFRVIDNCHMSGNITTSGNYVGGISVYLDPNLYSLTGYINNCTSDMDLWGSANVGGISTLNHANIYNCSTTGTIRGTSNVGGIVSLNSKNIFYSSSTANISGTGRGGGLVGDNRGLIEKCYFDGYVIGRGTGQSFGGLVGNNNANGIIRESNSNGVIKAYRMLGGFSGISSGLIEDCYTHCYINNTDGGYAGGGVGFLTNSSGDGIIINSYSVTQFNYSLSSGGFIGVVSNAPIITSCYYDTDVSGKSDVGKGEPKTTVEMKQQATFTGWDFTNTWDIVETYTYPYLDWQMPSTYHNPIRINSNTDFISQNGVSSGIGTVGDPYIIENWNINASGYGCGIYVGNTTKNFTIRNCSVFDASGYLIEYYYDSGIYLHNTTNATIFNNDVSGNEYYGILLRESSNNSIIDNNVKAGNEKGIVLYYSSNYNNVIGNNIVGATCINIYQSSNNSIINNNITGVTGIFISSSSYNHIINNYIFSFSNNGIYIVTSSYNHIINNDILENRYGIQIQTSFNNIITGNNISENTDYGIYIQISSNYNHIYHNNFISNIIQVEDNSINYWNSTYLYGGNYWSDYAGVDLYHGENQDILGSDEIGDTPFIFTTGQDNYPLMEYWQNYTFPIVVQMPINPIRINSNTDFTFANGVTGGTGTSGDPYIINNWIINAIGYGCGIYVGNTTAHFEIRNCTIYDASGDGTTQYYYNSGIYLYNLENATIKYNNLSGNKHGIYLEYLSNSNIFDNDVLDNSYSGIYLTNSFSNNINNNNISETNNFGIYSSLSTNNIITNNNISENDYGICVTSASNNNIITNNIISGNTNHGLFFISSYYNHIYHNSLIGNAIHVYDEEINYWNATYPNGGNYYDNYTGVDLYHGINQDILGSDGIGDTPFIFITGQDYYPLMEYWGNITHNYPIRINSDTDFTLANGVTSGTGTSGDPYIIENWIIDATGYGCGIYVGNTTAHFVIRNCTIYNASGYPSSVWHGDSQITFKKVRNATIDNNILYGGLYGIYIEQLGSTYYSKNINITRNNISFVDEYGILITLYCKYFNITDNHISNNKRGILLMSSFVRWVNIINNTISDSTVYGIHSSGSAYNNIFHNNFINIIISDSGANNQWDNGYQFGGNYWDDYSGVDLYHGINQDILGSDGIGDTPYIFPIGQDNYPLMYPFETNNTPLADAGVDDMASMGTNYQFNGNGSSDAGGTSLNWTWTFTYNSTSQENWGEEPLFEFWTLGVYVVTLTVTDDCYNTDIDTVQITVSTIHTPIRINSDTDFTFANGVTSGTGTFGDPYIIENWIINASGYGCGIFVGNTTKYVEIKNCTVYEASGINSLYYTNSGIYLHNSQNVTIINNDVSESEYYGILLHSLSNYNNIINNKVIGNLNGIHLYTSSYNNISYNNVTGNSNYGIHLISTSSYNNISYNNVIGNSGNGINIALSSYNNITGNNVSGCFDGIKLLLTSNNSINNNNVTGNFNYGIHLDESSNNNIIDNDICNNANGINIFWLSKNNNITSNNVSGSLDGILISISNNNNINNNNISGNTNGIRLTTSFYCNVYHNNFIGNTIQVYDAGINYFNSTYQFGGNYYDNYIGVDLYHGKNQDILGSDGIGDTSFIFITGQDYYPLMHPFETNNTPVADAGQDDIIGLGTSHQFNGIQSSDAGGTSLNYTWTFIYNSTSQEIWGEYPSFEFWTLGIYDVTLTIKDDCYNIDIDTVQITVLTIHTPIRINSDIDFTFANGVTSGTGTSIDPYIIDNWIINATGYGCGIFVGNTTKYFEIRNCTVYDASSLGVAYYYNTGIYLYNSHNATILNNNVSNNDRLGIYLELSTNNTISENDILYNLFGVGLAWSSLNNNITNNNITNNINEGISIANSDYNNMIKNNISDNGDGISLSYSNYNNISENIITNNSFGVGFGIKLFNSDYNNMIKNNISYTGFGIELFDSDCNIMKENNMLYNNYGIADSNPSYYNHIYHNNFIGNVNAQITMAFTNYLNSTYQFGGNYYDDYSGVDLYHGANQDILGSDNIGDTFRAFGNIDYYPLMYPFETNNTPIADAGVDLYSARIHHINGMNSSDAGGTSLNYTWNFTYNSIPYIFWGESFHFDFVITGNYTITLNVTDDCGNYDIDTMIVYVIPIEANAGSDDTTYRQALYQFDGTGSIGNIVNYTWTFTDGITQTLWGSQPEYTFTNLGIYNVTLNITDLWGATDEDWIHITVLNNPPVAEAGANHIYNRGIHALDGSGSSDIDGSIINYTWTFADGILQTLYTVNPSYNFTNTGTFVIMLRVIDNDGGIGFDNVTITINNLPPIADAGVDQTGLRNTYIVSGNASYDPQGIIENYTWTFVYNSTTYNFYDSWFDFYFYRVGNYEVTLTVKDVDGASDTDIMWVNITGINPIADAGMDIVGKRVLLLDGTGSSDPDGTIMNWTWEFIYDGGTIYLYGETPSFDFNITGVYTITLTVTDDDGLQHTDTVDVTVDIILPIADATYLPAGTNKGIYTFDGTGSSDPDGTIVNYTWTFTYNGSPVELYGDTQSFDFQLEGSYLITLTVRDNDWRIDSDTMTIDIVFLNPNADAGTDIIDKRNITLDGTGSNDQDGTIVNWTWTFTYNGSPMELYGETPYFDFNISGAYVITLTVTDDDSLTGVDTVTVNVNIVPPFADAGTDITDKRVIALDGSASYDSDGTITNYTWTFTYNGNPVELYGATPSFDFNISGVYIITLTVLDDDWRTGVDTVTVNVNILPPVADAEYSPIGTQKGLYNLDATGSYDSDGTIMNWTWEFTYNGNPVVLYGETQSFNFILEDTYLITLTVTDDDWRTDTDTTTIEIIFINPVADAEYSPISTNKGIFTMDGSGSSDIDGTVENYTWNFNYGGNPIELYGSIVSYNFQLENNYEIILTVTDDDGLTDTSTIWINIIHKYPQAMATMYVNDTDKGMKYLDGTSSTDEDGVILTHVWTFMYDGNPITLNGDSVSHNFSKSGNYTVTLTVTDDDGLTDVKVITFQIIYKPPVADAGDDRIHVTGGNITTSFLNVTLDGSASYDTDGGYIANYTWSYVYYNVTYYLYGEVVNLTAYSNESYVYYITLNVTDEDGLQANCSLVIEVMTPIDVAVTFIYWMIILTIMVFIVIILLRLFKKIENPLDDVNKQPKQRKINQKGKEI